MIENLWVEKYRPKNLDDLIIPIQYKNIFKKYIEEQSLQNIILYGDAGTGKTALARILIDAIIEHPDDVLYLNGSSDNGIDIIRNVVDNFITTPSFSGGFKIVFFDEADYLSLNAQAALRAIMESGYHNCRFIFTCNFFNKVKDAIQSRCQCFQFKNVSSEYVKNYCVDILDKEQIEYKEEDLDDIIDSNYPDIRKIIDTLQSNSMNRVLTYKNEKQVEDEVISIVIKIFESISKKDRTGMETNIKTVHSVIIKQPLDFIKIYKKIFASPDFPYWMKIKVNKALSDHLEHPIPEMNFMSYIYGCIECVKQKMEMRKDV